MIDQAQTPLRLWLAAAICVVCSLLVFAPSGKAEGGAGENAAALAVAR